MSGYRTDMNAERETVEGVAAGTIAPTAQRYVRLTLTDGAVTEGDVLEALQRVGLVSADVRAVYLETLADDGALIVTALDVDSGDTIAWVTLPMGAGV